MNSMQSLRNRVAVAGIGNTRYGDFPDVSDYALGAQAFRLALADCGLAKDEVDGLLCCRVPFYARMGEILGLNPRWTSTMPGHGRMSGMAIVEAMMAIESGAANHVALIYTNIGRSRRMNYGGDEFASFWDPWGLTSPGASHALMFRMHMERYGTTTRQLGAVSVAFRNNAMLNPDAVMRKPITLDDHQNSRWIVEPLRLLDCCQESDGAVALVVTRAERARDLKHKPALIRAAAQGAQDEQMNMTSFYRADIAALSEMRLVAQQLYAMSGLAPEDIQTAILYDHFSPFVLPQLEVFGFCGRGEGKDFVRDGNIELGGGLPVNTHGGQLGEAYIHGLNGVAEAVRQVRGTAVNQVPGVLNVLVTAGTGVPTSAAILAAA